MVVYLLYATFLTNVNGSVFELLLYIKLYLVKYNFNLVLDSFSSSLFI